LFAFVTKASPEQSAVDELVDGVGRTVLEDERFVGAFLDRDERSLRCLRSVSERRASDALPSCPNVLGDVAFDDLDSENRSQAPDSRAGLSEDRFRDLRVLSEDRGVDGPILHDERPPSPSVVPSGRAPLTG